MFNDLNIASIRIICKSGEILKMQVEIPEIHTSISSVISAFQGFPPGFSTFKERYIRIECEKLL